jgi:hypothetical protein
VPVLTARSVGAADGSPDGGTVLLDAFADSEALDLGSAASPDVPIGPPLADAGVVAPDSVAGVLSETSDTRPASALDVRLLPDVVAISDVAWVLDEVGGRDGGALDVGAALDATSSIDGGARGVDGALDSGPKPILLVDGGTKNLVSDDTGCSISAVGARGRSTSALALLPFLALVAARLARRRGRP